MVNVNKYNSIIYFDIIVTIIFYFFFSFFIIGLIMNEQSLSNRLLSVWWIVLIFISIPIFAFRDQLKNL